MSEPSSSDFEKVLSELERVSDIIGRVHIAFDRGDSRKAQLRDDYKKSQQVIKEMRDKYGKS